MNPTQVDMTHTNNRRNEREPRRASMGADTRLSHIQTLGKSGPRARRALRGGGDRDLKQVSTRLTPS